MTGRYVVARHWRHFGVFDLADTYGGPVAICATERDADDLASLMNQQNKSGAGMPSDAADDSSTEGTARSW